MKPSKNEKNKSHFTPIILCAVFLCLIATVLLILHLIPQQADSDGTSADASASANTANAKSFTYNDHTYYLRDSIKNYLCIGVDKYNEGMNELNEYGTLGQSDTLFVVSVDDANKAIRIIGIPRDLMVMVHLYDLETGEYQHDTELPITLQFSYGSTAEQSAELTEGLVSELFQGIDFDGYAAITVRGIVMANDAVDGVTVTTTQPMKLYAAETYDTYGLDIPAGVTLTLHGYEASGFCIYREKTEGAALVRLENQKQYAHAFLSALSTKIKSDPLVITDLYSGLKDYMVTDVSALDAAGLVANFIGYDISTITTVPIEDANDYGLNEYVVDEDAWMEEFIGLFCEGES